MSERRKWLHLILFLLFGITSISSHAAFLADSVTLYTPYTRISVPPGESINYNIDVINNTAQVKNLGIVVAGIPKGWNYVLKSGSWEIGQIAVLPGQKQTLSLKVDVPLKINKGTYRVRIVAGEYYSLPLAVNVAEQGSFETEFTTQQANMEGHANSNFNFTAILNNHTAEKQLYALRANALPGWVVTFKANYIQVTSVENEPNTTKDIAIEINPPDNIEAGTYRIPVSAGNSSTAASLTLEIVITGTFSMELTTPTGLLSTSITRGEEKKVELLVRNTGSSPLNNINLASSSPVNWSVSFEPVKVDRLEPGANAQVFATIKADKRAIAGDYVTNLEAKTPETSSKATFRISVKTPMLLGWIGIFIILAAAGSVYYLFRKYGRR